MNNSIELSFKVIIVGPSAVGKTSLINRFVHNEFALKYKLTIGVDFLTKTGEFQPSKLIKLHIWDIGGQERFKFLHRSFYEGASGAVLVFDLSRQNTFSGMKTWLSEMRSIMTNEILGRKDIGYLEVDMAADIFMLDTSRLQYVGTNKDPVALLATVGVNHPVDYTIINGKIVVENGKILTINEKDIVSKSNIKFEKFINM